jgi:peptide-methionine (S)-S-oxide reductase
LRHDVLGATLRAMSTSEPDSSLATTFRAAVSAVDAGDVATLDRLLRDHPALATARLEGSAPWLRDQIGAALDGFFRAPYLLWFVAEDPVRNGTLPPNIAQVAATIIEAAKRSDTSTLQAQLDYALSLVSWSWIAAQHDVQLALIDVLIDAGANPDGNPNKALVNGHLAAAEHLVQRGAKHTLASALCLARWDDTERLLPHATEREKRFAFVLAALNGRHEALRRMIEAGVDVNAPSEDLYSHGTPLHHAVCSGSLDSVSTLAEAGAKLTTTDTLWNGTPLGWAEHYVSEHQSDSRGKDYAEIADYLRAKLSDGRAD